MRSARGPRFQTLLRNLDDAIREHENFLADPAHYTLEPVQKRLGRLRAARLALSTFRPPESCACSRGGNPARCECRDWPDEQARAILRECSEVGQGPVGSSGGVC